MGESSHVGLYDRILRLFYPVSYFELATNVLHDMAKFCHVGIDLCDWLAGLDAPDCDRDALAALEARHPFPTS